MSGFEGSLNVGSSGADLRSSLEGSFPHGVLWKGWILNLLLLAALSVFSEVRAASASPDPVPPPPKPLNGTTGGGTNALADAASPVKPEDSQRLSIGDRVSFRVIEEKIEPKPLLVADSGELEIPYIGRVMAKDRTCQELSVEIKEKLEAKYFYRATVVLSVELLNPVRGSVYLFGEVRSAGAQFLPSNETLTLAKAIVRAGGFTDFADRRHVKVTRETASGSGGTNRVFTVDVGRILQKGETQLDVKLEPGDIIYVATRLVNF